MATAADERLLELLDKWLKSLELHLKYSTLDEASYARIQPWVEHQRPTRWIIDLAKQKAIALKTQVEERIKMGDAKFADSLELMIFLGNLLGGEHIERFIPLADAENEQPLGLQPPDDATVIHAVGATATREMPRFAVPKAREEPEPVSTSRVTRTERKAAVPEAAPPPVATKAVPARPAKHKQTSKPAAHKPATHKPVPKQHDKPRSARAAEPAEPPPERISGISDKARDQVIADAARLVQWGRKWYELAELISRMADRPSLPDVRRILKDNKPAIDKRAGGRP